MRKRRKTVAEQQQQWVVQTTAATATTTATTNTPLEVDGSSKFLNDSDQITIDRNILLHCIRGCYVNHAPLQRYNLEEREKSRKDRNNRIEI